MALKLNESGAYGLTDKAIIFGQKGLDAYLAAGNNELPQEGRFCGIFHEDQQILIRTDLTGQEIIYLFRDGEDWAISNSFALLVQQMALRYRLDFYAPAGLVFHLNGGRQIGEQLISHKTMVRQISILPVTSYLKVDRGTGALSEVTRPYSQLFHLPPSENYEAKMLDTLERCSGIMAALVDAGLPMNLFLSGGYDSRLVLAMLLMSGKVPDRLRVTSRPHLDADFKVAIALTSRFHLPLNKGGPSRSADLGGSEAIRLYLLSSAGTYLPFHMIYGHRLQQGAELRLTGDQPTGWSFYAGTGLFNGTAPKIADDIARGLAAFADGEAVRQDFFSVFQEIDVDPEDPIAMLAQYNVIRSRHHCGRHWTRAVRQEVAFTPLMQSSFVALDIVNRSAKAHPTKFFADAYSAIGGWPLEEPFETPERAFPQEMLDSSPFRGGVQISPRPFTVFGDLAPDAAYDQPDLLSMPAQLDRGPEPIRHELATMMFRADHARQSSLFREQDFVAANREIAARGTISDGYRKTCQIIAADTILRLLASGPVGQG